MNKKLLLTLCSFCIFMLAFSLSVCADSTSDSLTDVLLHQVMVSQNGAAYEAPFVVPEGLVDSSTGAVNVLECDLSLPGKNGLDVNLYRRYNSHNPDYHYNYVMLPSNARTEIYVGVPYHVAINGVDCGIEYVAYSTEEGLREVIHTTEEIWNKNQKVDEMGNEYAAVYHLDLESPEVVLTMSKDTPPIKLYNDETMYYSQDTTANNLDLGYGWKMLVPSMVYKTRYDYASGTDDDGYYYDKYIGYSYLQFEDGKIELLKYRYQVTSKAEKEYELINTFFSNSNSRYTVEGFVNPVTDSRGFTYHLKISNEDGKNYYFNVPNFPERANGTIVAITDRYNNCILYNDAKATDSTPRTITITDTYGRKITVTKDGIVVEAGDMTKRVDYNRERILDPIDPNGYYHIPHTYKFQVIEYTGAGTSGEKKQTTYTMKRKTISDTDSYYSPERMYYYLEEIQYPTDSRREFVYEEKPLGAITAYNVYFIDETKVYEDLYVFRVAEEKLYEADTLKNDITYSYEGTWKASAKMVWGTYKTFAATETLENGHMRKNKRNYDSTDRLVSDVMQYYIDSVINPSYYESIVYNYDVPNDASNIRKIRRAPLQNITTYQNDTIVTSQDYDYRAKSTKLTKQEQGEKCTTYTYDDTFCVPLTITTTQANGQDIKQVNTLTEDKKGIATTQTYEGDTLKDTVTYTYYSDGTLKSETHTGTAGAVTTEFLYGYQSDKSHFVYTTVKNIADASGNLKNINTRTDFDSLGRKVAETDGNGNTTRYEYDMLGQVTKQINPDGTYQQVAYSVTQNKLTVTDENGNKTTRQYSPLGNLETIYLDDDPTKVAAFYTYDNQGRKTSETAYQQIGGMAISNEYAYDHFDRIATVTSKENDTVLDVATNTYGFDEETVVILPKVESGDSIDVTNYQKAEITFYYMSVNVNYSANWYTIKTDGEEIIYQSYNDDELTTEFVDLTDVETLQLQASRYGSFYALIRLLPNDSPSNLIGGAYQTVTTTYQGDDYYTNPTKVTTLNGYEDVVAEEYYDGTVSEETLLNANFYQHDLKGNVIQTLGGRTYMENLGNYTTKTEYDYMGNPVKEYRADGRFIENTYDASGNLTAQTDYAGNTTTYTYDGLNRQIGVTAPFAEGVTTQTLTYYDNHGNVVMTKQQNNAVGAETTYATTEHEYDSRNRLIATKVNDGTQDIYTQYAYDGVGNMVRMITGQTSKLTDLYNNLPSGVTHVTYEYDRFGNVIKETDSEGRVETAEYNLMGLPTTQTDKNGISETIAYNAYGSPEYIWGDDYMHGYSYNVNNLLLAEIKTGDLTTGLNYEYDKYGRIRKETTRITGYGVKSIAEYTYDVNGNRKSFQLTDCENVVMQATYTYDILDRPTKVSFGDSGLLVNYAYDVNGQLTFEANGNNTALYGYNDAGLVTTLNNSNGTDYTYTYRLDGNQIEKTDVTNGITTNYTYDGIGQLKKETTVNNGITTTTTYTYDSRGNRIGMNNGGIISQYTYDTSNRLLSRSVQTNASTETKTNYTYDQNGNLIFKRTEQLTDAAGRKYEELDLYNIEEDTPSMADDMLVSYTYNTVGQLTSMSSEHDTVTYNYDVSGRRIRKTVNGDVTNYVWDGQNIVCETDGNDAAIAKYMRGNRLIAQIADGKNKYYTYDAHGSVTGITGESYTYDAFGNLQNETTADNPFRYSGEYYEAESGMIYLRNRYYDPELGRFITEDPVHDGLNWYVYCGNNPLKYIDPTGLSSEERLGEGIWTFKNDKFGVSILSHWLFGGGADYIQENGVWGTYMKDNSLLKTKVQEIVFPLANDVKNNSSKTIDITTSMEIQNGEDIIGYQYLHGTNADVGGFQIKGTVSKNKKGDITYDLTYTWNDKIDPNFMYYSDSKKAEFAKSIPLANPTDYTIRITWSDKTVIKANPTWYNWNTGWLK